MIREAPASFRLGKYLVAVVILPRQKHEGNRHLPWDREGVQGGATFGKKNQSTVAVFPDRDERKRARPLVTPKVPARLADFQTQQSVRWRVDAVRVRQ